MAGLWLAVVLLAMGGGVSGYQYNYPSAPYNLSVTVWNMGYGFLYNDAADLAHDRLFVTDDTVGTVHVLSLSNGSLLFDIPPFLPLPGSVTLSGLFDLDTLSSPGTPAFPPALSAAATWSSFRMTCTTS